MVYTLHGRWMRCQHRLRGEQKLLQPLPCILFEIKVHTALLGLDQPPQPPVDVGQGDVRHCSLLYRCSYGADIIIVPVVRG